MFEVENPVRGTESSPVSPRQAPTAQRLASPEGATDHQPAGLVRSVSESAGTPLDNPVRQRMERAFSADFSSVRIHTDRTAEASALALGARAYTVGDHVAFDRGAYAPNTPSGHKVLAHELAHVVQQRSGVVTGRVRADSLRVSDPADVDEQEAEATANRVACGQPAHSQQDAAGVGYDGRHPQRACCSSSVIPVPESMGRTLGRRLGGLRIHLPTTAPHAAAVDAVAFTAGEDTVLGGGAQEPANAARQVLIQDEAAHVVQQRDAAYVVEGDSRRPGDAGECAADALAQGGEYAAAGGALAVVQRQIIPDKVPSGVATESIENEIFDYLERKRRDSGRRELPLTPEIQQTILLLAQGNVSASIRLELFLTGPQTGDPAALARGVVAKLPVRIQHARVAAFRKAASGEAVVPGAQTAGEALGRTLVDSTVTPVLRALRIPKQDQDTIVDAARSAVADGTIGLLEAALGGTPLDQKTQAWIKSTVEGIIKQHPGKPMDRQQEGAGRPSAKEEPPTAVPPPIHNVPGEKFIPGPKVPFDFGVKKPTPETAPQPKIDPALQAAAAGVDAMALTPPLGGDSRGVGAAPVSEFALEVAKALDAAHNLGRGTVAIEVGAYSPSWTDRGAFYGAVKALVYRIRDRLPHHAEKVRRVQLSVGGSPAFGFSLHPSGQ